MRITNELNNIHAHRRLREIVSENVSENVNKFSHAIYVVEWRLHHPYIISPDDDWTFM